MSEEIRSSAGPTPDDAGFRQWLAVAGPALRRKAFLMSGDWHAADDLCQEVFIQMYSRWPKIAKGGNVNAYANRVLAGCYIDTTRRPWRRERVSDVIPDVVDRAADEAMDRVDGGDAALELALGHLPANQRVVVVLRFTDDLTVDEIARELNIPAGTVKSRLSRGIETLRSELSLAPHAGQGHPATDLAETGSTETLFANGHRAEFSS
mgnify:CR=1 FL=1